MIQKKFEQYWVGPTFSNKKNEPPAHHKGMHLQLIHKK
jgi:hypothetical protein